MKKNKLFKVLLAAFSVMLFITAAIVAFSLSPLHPKNISDADVISKGTQHTVKLTGIYEYDGDGFVPATECFDLKGKKSYVYTDENGYARTDGEEKSDIYILGKYSSSEILYADYRFCGERYKNQAELEAFFETRDPIYNFDVNKLPEYIGNVIGYEKRFSGSITVKIYKGRCVITELYIGNEKVLEINQQA